MDPISVSSESEGKSLPAASCLKDTGKLYQIVLLQ